MWKKKKQNQKEELFERNSFYQVFFLVFFFTVSISALADNNFTFNENLRVAQFQNYELKLDGASSILEDEAAIDPANSCVLYLQHSNAFLKAFVSEEQVDYTAYRKVQDNALLHFDKLPEDSPYKKFAQSEIYFYSATLKAKFDELYGAARDINRANTLIEANYKKFPNFLPNNKTRGIIKVYLSTVPDNYSWVIRMLGIKGNLNQGLALLKTLSRHKSDSTILDGVAKETAYLYSFSLLHVAKQPITAWSETLKCTDDYKTNLTSNFFRSNIAMKLNKNETAIQVLEARPKNAEYSQFWFAHYLLGVAKMNKQDTGAIVELNAFYTNFRGRNYIKSCLQKMSWYYTIQGNTSLATKYKGMISTIGFAMNEEDKHALGFVKKHTPHPILLKTRLLYDGGYTIEALEAIEEVDPKKLATIKLKAEFCYRRGRIAQKQGEMARALKLYEACSLFALDSDEYYGAYASIYIADYYLSEEDKVLARKFYERALGFEKNKEYVESIEQRAKAGLKKC